MDRVRVARAAVFGLGLGLGLGCDGSAPSASQPVVVRQAPASADDAPASAPAAAAEPKPEPESEPGLPALVEPEGFPAVPAISGAWLGAEPVELARESRVVIVEAWATWCMPCREQFPHLTQLQRDEPERLLVVGVSNEPRATVEPFVVTNRDQIGYAIVADGAATLAAYEELGPISGIPHAYLVRDARLMWQGHPADIDHALGQVLEGRWTPRSAALAAELPQLRARYLEHLRAGEASAAAELAAVFRNESITDPTMQNNVAWDILTEVPAASRDLELAVELAERAVARTERSEWAHLDTLALALHESGARERAISEQREALRLCWAANSPDCAEVDARLRQFSSE